MIIMDIILGSIYNNYSPSPEKNSKVSLKKTTYNKRESYLDAIAGLLIMNMIIYHYSPMEWQKYLGFFIPWFFFKGGLFFKVTTIKNSIYKCEKLIRYFIIFSFVGYVLNSIKLLLEGDYNIIHYTLTPIKELVFSGAIEGNHPLWFLTTLVMSRIVYNYIIVSGRSPKLVCLVSLFAICISHLLNFVNPMSIFNVLNGTFFYALGDLSKKYQDDKKFIIVSFSITMIIALFCIPKATVLGEVVFKGNYFIWLIYSITGCISITALFRIIPYSFPILSMIGRRSLIILVTHWLLLYIINTFLPRIINHQFSNSENLIILYSLFVVVELCVFSFLHNREKMNNSISFVSE